MSGGSDGNRGSLSPHPPAGRRVLNRHPGGVVRTRTGIKRALADAIEWIGGLIMGYDPCEVKHLELYLKINGTDARRVEVVQGVSHGGTGSAAASLSRVITPGD